MDVVREKGCAKINLCLDVVGIREDSYHSIESVMQCVTFGDDVTVSKTDREGISLDCSDKSLPTVEKNLAYKAAFEFYEYIDEVPSVAISLVKHIPDKAGLAGGSADAAAVLRALNSLTEAHLSDEELRKIAENIGSDVIFCVSSDPSFVTGRGEIIEECKSLPDCAILLAKGISGVQTKGAYKRLDDTYGDYSSRGKGASKCLDAMESGDLSAICDSMFNIFEDIVISDDPTVKALKEEIKAGGALASMMSGSGSAVFGIFDDEAKANETKSKLTEKGIWAVVCRPLK